MRQLGIISFSLFYVFVSAFCQYQPQCIVHLMLKENYIQTEVEINGIDYNEDDYYSFLNVHLTDYEHYEEFNGEPAESADVEDLQNEIITLKLIEPNAQILKDAGFFEAVESMDEVVIRTTAYMFDGVAYHYVAEVILDGMTYLSFEEGYGNIVENSTRIRQENGI